MSLGCFTERLHTPTEPEITGALSGVQSLWERIISVIAETYHASGELKFYGRNYGWALGFTKGGKALVSLYPGKEEFYVQIILNSSQVDEALALDLVPEIKRVIEATPPVHEGKWIFIKIAENSQVADILKLIEVRQGRKYKSVGASPSRDFDPPRNTYK